MSQVNAIWMAYDTDHNDAITRLDADVAAASGTG